MRYSDLIDSPIGELRVEVDARGRLIAVQFGNPEPKGELTPDPARCARVTGQLQEYFAGERRDFDLELALEGTDFERSVWQALLDIP